MRTVFTSLFCLLSITILEAQNPNSQHPKGEVMYHVCQRSFYDSDGDLHGDLNGRRKKLPYLQDLGITSILLFPL